MIRCPATISSGIQNILSRNNTNDIANLRMADFVLLGEAVHKALHIKESFKEVFLRNRTESLRRSLESSPVAMAVQDLISVRKEYSGTIKQLKATLDEGYRQEGEGWPKSPRGLSEALKRTAPALREIGIDIEFLGHQRDGSHISIKALLLSENNHHNDHIVTDQPKTKQLQALCDGVTVVTNDFGKLKNPNGDIREKYDYHAAKYGE